MLCIVQNRFILNIIIIIPYFFVTCKGFYVKLTSFFSCIMPNCQVSISLSILYISIYSQAAIILFVKEKTADPRSAVCLHCSIITCRREFQKYHSYPCHSRRICWAGSDQGQPAWGYQSESHHPPPLQQRNPQYYHHQSQQQLQ